MPPHILRLAYVSEFLLALVAALEMWNEVGGHLELMPWYTKLGLIGGMAAVTVMGTISAVSHENAWNAKTVSCLILAALIACGMAGASYYYHLHENGDEDNSAENPIALSSATTPARIIA